jgi:hypothetical protein
MARQKGLIRVKGLLGDISFYQSGGKDLMKTPGGASKEKIMTDPKFVRTRENMSEFGGSAMVGKALRLGVIEVKGVFGGRYMSAELLGIFKKVCTNGTGLRGARDFEIVANKLLIEGFNFDKAKILAATFNAPYTFVTNAGRNETTFTVADFNTTDYIHAPEGATHFRFVGTASVLSDYKLNVTSGKYEPLNPAIEGLNIVAYSSYIPVGGMVGSTTTVIATIAVAPTMPTSAGLIGCIGIEFFQIVNTVYNLLNADNCMRIENVF